MPVGIAISIATTLSGEVSDIGAAVNNILQEDLFNILLEDGSGVILVE